MKKIFLLLFLTFSLVSQSAFNTHVKYELGWNRQGKQIRVNAKYADIYCFDGTTMVSKIAYGKKGRIFVANKNYVLYSNVKIKDDMVSFEESSDSSMELKKKSLYIDRYQTVQAALSIWFFIILALLVSIRISSREVFFALIMPWAAQMKSEELLTKINPRRLIIPIILFVLSIIASVWVFNTDFGWTQMIYAIVLLLLIFLFKVFLLFTMEFLLENRGLARKHMIEYLKMGIFCGLTFFLLRTLEILNHWDFHIVYEIILFTYFIVWFIRLILLIYTEAKQKVIYFFSYLCISEVAPILLVLAFWRN